MARRPRLDFNGFSSYRNLRVKYSYISWFKNTFSSMDFYAYLQYNHQTNHLELVFFVTVSNLHHN